MKVIGSFQPLHFSIYGNLQCSSAMRPNDCVFEKKHVFNSLKHYSRSNEMKVVTFDACVRMRASVSVKRRQ